MATVSRFRQEFVGSPLQGQLRTNCSDLFRWNLMIKRTLNRSLQLYTVSALNEAYQMLNEQPIEID